MINTSTGAIERLLKLVVAPAAEQRLNVIVIQHRHHSAEWADNRATASSRASHNASASATATCRATGSDSLGSTKCGPSGRSSRTNPWNHEVQGGARINTNAQRDSAASWITEVLVHIPAMQAAHTVVCEQVGHLRRRGWSVPRRAPTRPSETLD